MHASLIQESTLASVQPGIRVQHEVFLQGKDKVGYSPHLENGDVVIVTNANKVVFTGKKWDQKLYRHHTG